MSKRIHPLLPCAQIVLLVCIAILLGVIYMQDHVALGWVAFLLGFGSFYILICADGEDY